MQPFRSMVIVVLMTVSLGCQDQPTGPLHVRGMNVNGYEFDYDHLPDSIQADAEDVRISAGKTQIEVVGGTLRVDGRSYGSVKPKDHISLVGTKVSVNGELRPTGD
ncbi:MAG TPA: hypothetical protein VG826_04540 [Pirellulales bacterium]|nr:hypothetical protein [Pirellulales bacterium]